MSHLRSLPNFAAFQYDLVQPPQRAKLRAWSGLMECERRLALCKWVREGVTEDPGPNYRLLVEDFAAAFILSFEAALQFLRKQWEEDATGDFWRWLQANPSYSLPVRGLRAIRHLYAHVEIQESTGRTVVVMGPSGKVRRHFWLPRLTPEKLASLRRPPLDVTEVAQWQASFGEMELDSVFEEALRDLTTIVSDAEEAHSW